MEIQKSEPAEEMESESHEKDLADNLLHSKKNKQRKHQEQGWTPRPAGNPPRREGGAPRPAPRYGEGGVPRPAP